MPRRSLADAPGAIHPAITSGINRQRIFWDSAEQENFIDRLVISSRKPITTGLPGKSLGFCNRTVLMSGAVSNWRLETAIG